MQLGAENRTSRNSSDNQTLSEPGINAFKTQKDRLTGWTVDGRLQWKLLPFLLLLHQHVWSSPRVLEVPLERIGQDLRHLCRSGVRIKRLKTTPPKKNPHPTNTSDS